MSEPREHDLLGLDESTEINHRQAIAEFKEDVFPAYRDEGMTLAECIIIYRLLTIYNRLGQILEKLDEKI
jgi:hypothetical protein